MPYVHVMHAPFYARPRPRALPVGYSHVIGYHRIGMGQSSTLGMIQQGAGLATSALALIPATGPFAPFAAIGVGLFSLFSKVFSGCGQTCIIASQDANKVSDYLTQNLAAYQASGHTQSERRTALQVFDTTWADFMQACGNPQLGSAGQRCISERQRGGASKWCCKSPTAVHVGNGMCTGCDYFVTLRDPIANDPHVIPDPPAPAAATSTAGTSAPATAAAAVGVPAFGSLPAWALPAALIGVGLVVALSGGNR